MPGRRLGCHLSGPLEASEPREPFDDELVPREKEVEAEIAAGCLTAAGLFYFSLRIVLLVAMLGQLVSLRGLHSSAGHVQCPALHCIVLHCTELY